MFPLELDGRRDELHRRYPGLRIKDVADPSKAVMQEFGRIHDADALRHVPWSAATMRKPELLSNAAAMRPHTGFEDDSRGYIKRVPVPVEVEAGIGSDLLLMEALVRRGLGAEAMHVMSWGEVGESIKYRLMDELRALPLAPNHQRVTLEQVQRADEWIWVRLAELTGSTGIKPRPDGRLPLDALAPKVSARMAVRCVSRGVVQISPGVAGPSARRCP